MKLRGVGVWAAVFLFIAGLTWVAWSNAGRAGTGVQAVSAAAPAQAAGPSWWPSDLPLPGGSAYRGEKGGIALWQGSGPGVDAGSSAFQKQAAAAGYQVFNQAAEQGQTYTMFVMKGGNAYRVKVDRAAGGATYAGRAVGIMHVKASGAAAAEYDVPLTGVPYTATEGYFNIASRAPAGNCAGCDYVINISVEPYNGPGTYTSKDALFDLGQAGPGHEYHGLGACSVTIKDAASGSYDCKGLTQNGSSKTLDVSGTWQIPPQQ